MANRGWPNVCIEPLDDGSYEVKLSEPLILEDWPHRVGSNKKVHIAIDGVFECKINDGKKFELVSYSTKIGYFEKNKELGCFIAVDGFHFDMAASLQRAHPVFHVQKDTTVLIDSFSKKMNCKCIPPERFDENRNIHLPTPQVDIVSALLMVIADHVKLDDESEQLFFELLGEMRKKFRLVANLHRQAHLERCIEEKEMLLYHWYAPVE